MTTDSIWLNSSLAHHDSFQFASNDIQWVPSVAYLMHYTPNRIRVWCAVLFTQFIKTMQQQHLHKLYRWLKPKAWVALYPRYSNYWLTEIGSGIFLIVWSRLVYSSQKIIAARRLPILFHMHAVNWHKFNEQTRKLHFKVIRTSFVSRVTNASKMCVNFRIPLKHANRWRLLAHLTAENHSTRRRILAHTCTNLMFRNLRYILLWTKHVCNHFWSSIRQALKYKHLSPYMCTSRVQMLPCCCLLHAW